MAARADTGDRRAEREDLASGSDRERAHDRRRSGVDRIASLRSGHRTRPEAVDLHGIVRDCAHATGAKRYRQARARERINSRIGVNGMFDSAPNAMFCAVFATTNCCAGEKVRLVAAYVALPANDAPVTVYVPAGSPGGGNVACPRLLVLAKIVVEPFGPLTENPTASCCKACVLPAIVPVNVAPVGDKPASAEGALVTTNEAVVDEARKPSSPSNEALISRGRESPRPAA